ncbi:MAG: signal peptidase II [Clostridia bacterium]|nr:signal peptidase II [Clostridia bacterium]
MLFWILITVGVVVLDQITKWLAVEYLIPVRTLPIIKDALHLTYVENPGAAFGMMQNSRWIFLLVSTVAIIAIIIYLIKFAPKNKLALLSLAFILGGGIGNMIDRVALGYVVDFIDFRLINFAVFNVADSFVCVGAALLIIYVLFIEGKENKRPDGDENG